MKSPQWPKRLTHRSSSESGSSARSPDDPRSRSTGRRRSRKPPRARPPPAPPPVLTANWSKQYDPYPRCPRDGHGEPRRPRVAKHGGTRKDPKANYDFPGMMDAASWRRTEVHKATRWYGCAHCGRKFGGPHAVYAPSQSARPVAPCGGLRGSERPRRRPRHNRSPTHRPRGRRAARALERDGPALGPRRAPAFAATRPGDPLPRGRARALARGAGDATTRSATATPDAARRAP